LNKKLLTTTEVQEMLSIGRTRVFSLIASGQLRSVLIGASRRIPTDAVEEFIQELLLESSRDS
jgi:excisionase family DNA binding protein